MDPEVRTWATLVRGRRLEMLPDAAIPPLRLPGRHYRIDAACAATAARGLGCGEATIREALGRFAGLPQRTELVAMIGGRRFYNDSSSTTPESTIAALESLESPLWLLAGGKNKGMDFGPLCETIVRRAAGTALFGAARHVLHEKLLALDRGYGSVALENLGEAFRWCWDRSQPGDAILLSRLREHRPVPELPPPRRGVRGADPGAGEQRKRTKKRSKKRSRKRIKSTSRSQVVLRGTPSYSSS